jgi:hypothetical protein
VWNRNLLRETASICPCPFQQSYTLPIIFPLVFMWFYWGFFRELASLLRSPRVLPRSCTSGDGFRDVGRIFVLFYCYRWDDVVFGLGVCVCACGFRFLIAFSLSLSLFLSLSSSLSLSPSLSLSLPLSLSLSLSLPSSPPSLSIPPSSPAPPPPTPPLISPPSPNEHLHQRSLLHPGQSPGLLLG